MVPRTSSASCRHGAPPKDSPAYQQRLPLMQFILSNFPSDPSALSRTVFWHSPIVHDQWFDLTLLHMMNAVIVDDILQNPTIVPYSEDYQQRYSKTMAVVWTAMKLGFHHRIVDEADQLQYHHILVPCNCLVPILESGADCKTGMRLGVCANCTRVMALVKLKLCGNCKCVNYCCKECQVAAWPGHKPLCKEYSDTSSR